MAMAKQHEQDIILPVAADVAQSVTSFALDIGTSLAKVVYRSKKDYKDGKPTFKQGDPKVGRLRLGLLQRLQPEALIQFVRDNVDRPAVGASPTYIPATGYGSSIYRRQLEQSLNIKLAGFRIPTSHVFFFLRSFVRTF
ncbi:hypothetical protein NP493_478g00010 [Ridgeia piscesae]|uniref:Uncharacterized protein n=1 Tax=Ridgeia piscesae TaxID=27915 RepID=A0AAD9KXY7_RIDPI|nr:hypothetical protein NP493_7365g00000 [Ridgeia piscesae]KAK2179637.1 hypothetical protein NP493_478g00010 [Ridgeia piscesae]